LAGFSALAARKTMVSFPVPWEIELPLQFLSEKQVMWFQVNQALGRAHPPTGRDQQLLI